MRAVEITTEGTNDDIISAFADTQQNKNEGIDQELIDGNSAVIDNRNKFKGLESYIDESKVPPAFSDLFMTIKSFEYMGKTFRYKELHFMELLQHGQSPYVLELAQIASKNPEKDKEQQLRIFEDLSFDRKVQLELQEHKRRKNILLESLVDVTQGGETLPLTDELINVMPPEMVNDLFRIVTREGAAETEAVTRFHTSFGS